jgi:hypothetical protein
MRTLHPPPGSPVLPRIIPGPALLEWCSENPSTTLSCLHEAQITESKARVGYLEIEAQHNIELRSEMQQNWCRVFAEYRQLRQDCSRVSMGYNELRRTVRDLVQFRRWEELRRPGEEDDRGELENSSW